MSITRDCSEEDDDSEGSDSDEGKSALLDRDGTLVGGGNEEQEGGGQEGGDHSEDQHRGIFRKRSTECTPNYSRQAQINMDTAARL